MPWQRNGSLFKETRLNGPVTEPTEREDQMKLASVPTTPPVLPGICDGKL